MRSEPCLRVRATLAAVAAFGLMAGSAPATALGADFVSTVVASHPIAYYRLDGVAGNSKIGATQYKAVGGVSVAGPGAVPGEADNRYAVLNGVDGYLLSTQMGGIGGAASLMAWVDLAALPADLHHFFYVAGESESGNDFDVQFETDNVLRFYTAAGGNIRYSPPPSSLLNQWHMILVTMNAASQSRVIYWDGKPVANDKGGGKANKSAALSIGASTVFGGRFFKGGIEEVALWNRALGDTEVASIYASAKFVAPAASTTAAVPAAPGASAMNGSGPFATTAKVEVEDAGGPVPLKREEQIAIMFLTAMQNIESDCQMHVKRTCSLDEMLAGPVAADGWHINRLKFDPRSTDPNYTYVVGASGQAWEAHANAKKPGLRGFYFYNKGFGGADAYYSLTGSASAIDKTLTGRGVSGDSFSTR